MKRTIKVDEGKTTYTFDDDASFVDKRGNTIHFVLIGKAHPTKDGMKYQQLTCSKKNWQSVRDFLLKCLSET